MFTRLRVWIGMVTVVHGVVLGFSGRWTDPWLWTYCEIWTATLSYGLLGIDNDLAQERFNPPGKGADAVALRFVRLTGVAHLVIGALDIGRWHLTPVPDSVRAGALAGMALAMVLIFRAMHENRFFSAVVRVQADRGHRVIETGPYSLIRHPGYAGMIAAIPLSGLALGSWLSFGVALVYSAMILRRVLFEDVFLLHNLDGYPAYARRVTGRLVPRLW
jgi:protein-S-isoprenylcysteine O-methyltransferase Ste14